LQEQKVSARRFVQLLVKRPPLTDDDLNQSLQLINLDPSKVGRVVELARATAGSVPQPGVLLRWCEQVLRSRDEALREWALAPGQSARAALDELLTWSHASSNNKGDRTQRQLSDSYILLGLNILIARRSLAPLDVLRSIASLGLGNRKTRRNVSPDREVTKLLIQANSKSLYDLARIVALAEGEIGSAEEARRIALATASELRKEVQGLETQLSVLSLRMQGLDRELAQRDTRIAELLADIEGMNTRALQDSGNLKARVRRFGERLSGLLADAWDAIDTDPPHPDVTKERLEIAREVIRGELEWLNKSLD
jgi:hypothetical protein